MDQYETLTRLALALAIGLLIGVERGWRERDEAAGERTAGLRTFALIGLSGGIWGLLSTVLGAGPLGLAFVALAGALTLFRWRETEREGTFGATTLVAAFLTFALGTYAVLGDMTAAAAAAVATAALLAAKEWLHAWLKVMTWPELRSALILLAMTFIVLPVLPDRGFGPFEALNPYALWLATIVIAGVSFAGYVAVKIVGETHGPLVTGIVGGVVSSTATTLALAKRARAAPAAWRPQLAGALAASAVMYVRVALIVAAFGAALLPHLAGPLAAAALVTVGAAVAVNPPWRKHKPGGSGEGTAYSNPFELRAVLAFGALLAVVVFLTKAFTETFGVDSGIVFAAVAGIADVDAITVSMTGLGKTAADTAEIAILVAVTANALSKSFLAATAGGSRFGGLYLAASLAAIAAGGAVALLQPWA